MTAWPGPGWSSRLVGGESSKEAGAGTAPVVVVTGASSGLGQAAAEALVGAGATVILACRNRAKGEAVAQTIASRAGGGTASVAELDVARPASVEAFSQWFADHYDHLHLLINNAGVMTPPPQLTPEGIELQWSTNHLGHFALTGHLLGPLTATPGSRVVAVSSLAAASGRIVDYDPTTLDGYSRFQAYANSKLANLVFALELERRLRASGVSSPIALAAHPGVTHTNLASGIGGPVARLAKLASRVTTQPVSQGVQPILRAATDPDARGGDYYGPAGFRQYRGRAVAVPIPASANDPALGPTLWAQSVALSGVDYL